MRYYQYQINGNIRLGVEVDGTVTDLTTTVPKFRTMIDFLAAAKAESTTAHELGQRYASLRGNVEFPIDELLSGAGHYQLLPPIWAPEVWAFGVTYMDSMRERQAESGSPDVYALVYNADRPEAFFKSTAERLVPPLDAVGIRGDSEWDVPEPELAFVLFGGDIVGYTVGNDMSSRSIEGANPLYLPQAKVYDRSCAIGPGIATPETVGDPQNLDVELVIERGGSEAFRGSANTSAMKRDCAYLADWLQRHNRVPDGTTVCTGTGTIPPPDFTLQAGDRVSITIDKIGTLTNPVVQV